LKIIKLSAKSILAYKAQTGKANFTCKKKAAAKNCSPLTVICSMVLQKKTHYLTKIKQQTAKIKQPHPENIPALKFSKTQGPKTKDPKIIYRFAQDST
jgi:hypothetical protein